MDYDYDEAFVRCAGNYAAGAHAAVGQKRKGMDDTDYIVHPLEVREILKRHGCSLKQQAAGLLHDVIEDTAVGRAQLEIYFGREVTDLVVELTKITRPEDGCREVRASIERAALSQASPEAQDIKLADCISNMRSCHHMGKPFAIRWLDEKELLLPRLTKGKQSLRDEAQRELAAARQRVKELP